MTNYDATCPICLGPAPSQDDGRPEFGFYTVVRCQGCGTFKVEGIAADFFRKTGHGSILGPKGSVPRSRAVAWLKTHHSELAAPGAVLDYDDGFALAVGETPSNWAERIARKG